jgi:hypothetical protein
MNTNKIIACLRAICHGNIYIYVTPDANGGLPSDVELKIYKAVRSAFHESSQAGIMSVTRHLHKAGFAWSLSLTEAEGEPQVSLPIYWDLLCCNLDAALVEFVSGPLKGARMVATNIPTLFAKDSIDLDEIGGVPPYVLIDGEGNYALPSDKPWDEDGVESPLGEFIVLETQFENTAAAANFSKRIGASGYSVVGQPEEALALA